MNIQTYQDMEIEILRQTERPTELVSLALQQTMHKDIVAKEASDKMLKFLLVSEHTSPLEHCTMTFRATGISRSLLAQVTRQRMWSFTSSSQHYQDYRDYPVVVSQEMAADRGAIMALGDLLMNYEDLVGTAGFPVHEARQILPNASAVNILITCNARSLVTFLRQRRCVRNVPEMVHFADLLQKACMLWFPELFTHVGAPCFMDGKCNQGRMMAEECKNAADCCED